MTLLFALVLAQDAATLTDQAQQLAVQGRTAEAAEMWKQALAKQPAYFPAAFNLGFFHYSRKEMSAAEPYLQTAVKAQPRDFNARFLLGQALAALGRGDDALRQWRVALEVQPAHVRLMGIMVVEYSRGGYFGEAAALAKRAAALKPDDVNLHLLAVKACQDAQDAAGPALALQGAQRFSTSARALFEHAWYLQREGKVRESAEWLRKAMVLDARYEEPFFFYGGMLLDEGKLKEGVALLRQAIELRPDYTAAAVALGRGLMELEQYPEAVAVLEDAARRAPQHPQPPLMLSRVWFRMGEEDKAEAAKELSLRLRRENNGLMEVRQSRAFR